MNRTVLIRIVIMLFASLSMFVQANIKNEGDYNVSFSGVLMDSPLCVINNDQIITVDFGNEVVTTRIDGDNYKKEIQFTLSCDKNFSVNQALRIKGVGAEFDPKALSSDTPNLAIAIYHDQVRYNLGEWLPFSYPKQPVLYAVPIKKAASHLSGGQFTALASLIVDYQ